MEGAFAIMSYAVAPLVSSGIRQDFPALEKVASNAFAVRAAAAFAVGFLVTNRSVRGGAAAAAFYVVAFFVYSAVDARTKQIVVHVDEDPE